MALAGHGPLQQSPVVLAVQRVPGARHAEPEHSWPRSVVTQVPAQQMSAPAAPTQWVDILLGQHTPETHWYPLGQHRPLHSTLSQPHVPGH
jgi:hypothetical protein